MNIDVREYLRINPISVHDLTLSGDAKDCFLFFPHRSGEEDTEAYKAEGYNVYTQKQVFSSIMKSIFRDLIEKDGDGFRLKFQELGKPVEWDVAIGLDGNEYHFKAWVRRKTWNVRKAEIEEELKKLEEDLDDKILWLRRHGRVNYAGAVELQSVEMKKFADLFKTFLYSIGQIWCYRDGSDIAEGRDDVDIETVVKHKHVDTRAEAMSSSFSSNRSGGKLIGEFYVGHKDMVSYDKTYALSNGTNLVMTSQGRQEGDLTYPLWGENVIDWRTPGKTHNNVPPCVNIRVRYADEDVGNLAQFEQRYVENLAIAEDAVSYVEAKYESLQVADLEDYTGQDLTDHDYILRMTLDGHETGGVKIMKQSLKMLLDLFTEDCNSDLSEVDGDGTVYSMQDILKPLLDRELVTKSEFVAWYNESMRRLSEILLQLQVMKGLLASMKPIVYVGKIIISTTDNTEDKVIQNYGGVRWRRMLNFLRGVNEKEDENRLKLGNKWGESYVCLRESNVPIHTHAVKLKNLEPGMHRDNKVDVESWMEKDKGGEDTRMVNEGAAGMNGVGNSTVEYEISPLEYRKEGSFQTMPHSNLPPYREVYIWECLEVTDEERRISGEPWEIVYDMGEADDGRLPVNAPYGYRTDWIDMLNPSDFKKHETDLPLDIPDASSDHYQFTGWQEDSESHIEEDNNAIKVNIGSYPGQKIPVTAVNGEPTQGNVYLKATWTPNYYTIHWDSMDGSSVGDWTRPYNTELGELPGTSRNGYTFVGWFTASTGGRKISKTTLVKGDVTYYARWKANLQTIRFDALDGAVRGAQTYETEKNYDDRLGSLETAYPNLRDWENLTFGGWYTDKFEGDGITEQTVVDGDATYYARYTGVARYEKVGNVNVNETSDVISNFGNGQYVISSEMLDLSHDFEVVVCVTTGDNVQNRQCVFSTPDGICFGVVGGKFMWSLGNGTDHKVGTCQTGQEYTLRLVVDGGQLTFQFRNGGSGSWTASPDHAQISSHTEKFILGQNWECKDADTSQTEHWTGTMDMSKSHMNIYGHRYDLKLSHKVTVTFNENGGTWTTTGAHSFILEQGSRIGRRMPADGAVTREHYTFNGWWTAAPADQGTDVSSNTVVQEDMTAYAHWIGDEMDVRLELSNGDRAFPNLNAKWQDESTAGKWIVAQTGLKYPEPESWFYPPVSGGFELSGWKWTDENNSVKYIGLPIEQQTVEIYPIPGREDNGLVMYAQWEAKDFNVTLNLNNGNDIYPYLNATWGSGENSDSDDKTVQGQKYNQRYNLGIDSSKGPTSNGYTFKNWMNGTVDPPHHFNDGDLNLTGETVDIVEDSTFYAQWNPKDVTLLLHPNFSDVSPSGNQTVAAKFGRRPDDLNASDSTATPRVPTKQYYMFDGYYKGNPNPSTGNVTGTSENPLVQYYTGAGKGVHVISSMDAQDLYAKWEPVTYQIKLELNPNGTTWPMIKDTKWGNNTTDTKYLYVKYKSGYPSFADQIGTTKPTAYGYEFKQWYRGSNSSNGHYFSDGQLVLTNEKVPPPTDENKAFWVQWKPKKFTVTLNSTTAKTSQCPQVLGGGTRDYDLNNIVFGKTIQESLGDTIERYCKEQYGSGNYPPTKTGYNFVKWVNITNNNATFYEGTTYNLDGNATYYAYWIVKTYTVTLDKQGGTGGTSSVSVNWNAALPNVSIPARTGHNFTGYWLNGTRYYWADGRSNISKWSTDSNVTLYADWTPITYSVYWYGASDSPKYEKYGTWIYPHSPLASGWSGDNYYYKFTGWKDGYGNGWPPGTQRQVTGNMYYWAQWQSCAYKNTTPGAVHVNQGGGGSYDNYKAFSNVQYGTYTIVFNNINFDVGSINNTKWYEIRIWLGDESGLTNGSRIFGATGTNKIKIIGGSNPGFEAKYLTPVGSDGITGHDYHIVTYGHHSHADKIEIEGYIPAGGIPSSMAKRNVNIHIIPDYKAHAACTLTFDSVELWWASP